MELFLIYIWLKLSTILWILACTALLTGVLFFVSKVAWTLEDIPDISFEKWVVTDEAKRLGADAGFPHSTKALWRRHVSTTQRKTYHIPLPKWFVWVPLSSGLLYVVIPDKTEAAVLVASSIAIDVAKSPEGTKIGQLLRGKANELLDAELKKLAPQPTK